MQRSVSAGTTRMLHVSATATWLTFHAGMTPLPARAQAHDAELSVFGGMMNSSTRITGARGEEPLTKPGFTVGVRYLKPTGPFFGLGFEALGLVPQERRTATLIANGATKTSFQSTQALVVARLGPAEGPVTPYLFAGAGVHATTFKMTSAPQPGYGWSDTGTQETRTLFNSRKIGPAGKIQLGVDVSVGGSAAVGAYGALHYMGNSTYQPTSQASGLGVEDVEANFTAVSYGMNVTTRF